MPVFPKIREVHIRNYKSIEQAVVRLGDLTVLVGANGSGKSNFVDAITFVRDCLLDSVEQAVMRRGGYVGLFWRHGSSLDAVGVRVVVDFPGGGVADYGLELSNNGGDFQSFVVEERCVVTHPGGQVARFSVKDGTFLEAIEGVRPQIERGRLALLAASSAPEYAGVYHFLTSVRSYGIVPRHVAAFQTPSAGIELLPDGANAASVLRHLKQVSPDRFERVSELVQSIVPGVRGIETHLFGGQYETIRFDEDGPSPAVTAPFFASSMSEGTLRVLGFLLAAYQSVTPSVLVIEEPEANIHPAAAEVVASVLIDASRRAQVLITTHSPEVLDYDDLSDDVFRVVAKTDGRTAIAPVSAASRQVIRDHLYSPGELLRIDELGADLVAARELSEGMDVFGPPARCLGEAA
jgi:predicted ATPase